MIHNFQMNHNAHIWLIIRVVDIFNLLNVQFFCDLFALNSILMLKILNSLLI